VAVVGTIPLLDPLTVLLEADGTASVVLEDLLSAAAGAMDAELIGLTWPIGSEPLLDLQVGPDGAIPTHLCRSLPPLVEPSDTVTFADGTPVQVVPVRPPHRPAGWLWVQGAADCGSLLRLVAAVLSRSTPLLDRLDDLAPHLNRARLFGRLQDAAVVCGRVAHDFDNVLTGILGFSELADPLVPADSLARGYLGEVMQVAQQGVRITQQLHKFSRGVRPRTRPSAPAVALAAEIERTQVGLAPEQRLRVRVAPDLPAVALDEDVVRQAVGPVLDNGREALPTAGGDLEVTAEARPLTASEVADFQGQVRPGPCVLITVADSGPGLAPEVRRKVLSEPFFTTKPRHRGLGLAVACLLLQTHGGGLAIDDRPGGGTRVRLALPIALPNQPPPTP
jgi:signal transduction histidine kinase